MSDDRVNVVVEPAGPNRRLDSWKAIADYLGRHVTTLQRWEHEEGLPIHRHHHEKRGSIYAYTAELDAWLEARSTSTPASMSTDADVGNADASMSDCAPEWIAAGPSPLYQADPGLTITPPGVTTTTEPDTPSMLGASPRAWWRLPVGTVAAGIALALTIVVGVAKDLFPTTRSDETFSLAVLPLKNRSPDQQPDYFVDGMTEALTTDLAALPGVRVIAGQSVMQYRDTIKPASVIASELSVNMLVEGAIQRSGQRIRVDIRVIDGETSRSLWAATFERDATDALTLQAQISREIASELHLTFDPAHGERLESRRPSSPDAWDAYLRARFFWNRRTHDNMQRAIEWYERAIQLDSSSAVLYAGLADVYATLGPPNTPVSELITRGTYAANKAIALDPLMGEPYAALGKLRSYAWDWEGAERNYRKAIDLAPRYAPARYWFGSFLANQGRCDEAVVQAEEAARLDPLSLPGNMVIAGIELKCGRAMRAVKRMETILDLDRSFGQAYDYLGRAHLIEGDTTQAIAMFERAMEMTGGRPTIEATLGVAYAREGRTLEAEAIARRLAERHAKDKVLASAWSVAIAHVGIGDKETALTWLEHAYADREEWLEALAADERFTSLHATERFQRLLAQLGLPRELPLAITRR
jgi:TolB-like protein/Tfp pilus assembly protein PilF